MINPSMEYLKRGIMGKKIAIIGGGISGIAAANIFQKNGHTVTVYEKHDRIGGVWAVSYPQV
ncbi:MAG: NAD(P)-binding protein, partial [Anaerolineae bacterium]|nr:NAD(P)-binding protein [Anaerolineae bacterium]